MAKKKMYHENLQISFVIRYILWRTIFVGYQIGPEAILFQRMQKYLSIKRWIMFKDNLRLPTSATVRKNLLPSIKENCSCFR